MTSPLTAPIATEHLHDLARAARARNDARHAGEVSTPVEAITLRVAGPEDARALLILEQLDGAAPLREPVLLAIGQSKPLAALSLDDGAVAADPFVPTADAVALLRLRAGGKRASRRRRPRGRMRLRLA